MLEYLFSAGDTNGDGVLDMDEFTAIVRYVDPLVKTAKVRDQKLSGGVWWREHGFGAISPAQPLLGHVRCCAFP
jgi:hypothetical protein